MVTWQAMDGLSDWLGNFKLDSQLHVHVAAVFVDEVDIANIAHRGECAETGEKCISGSGAFAVEKDQDKCAAEPKCNAQHFIPVKAHLEKTDADHQRKQGRERIQYTGQAAGDVLLRNGKQKIGNSRPEKRHTQQGFPALPVYFGPEDGRNGQVQRG